MSDEHDAVNHPKHYTSSDTTCFECGRTTFPESGMMRIYVAGPMTGVAEHNFPAFRAAADRLRRAGFTVLDPSRHGAEPDRTWVYFLRRDLADLLMCDGVAVLDRWESSRGANLEVHVARSLEMPVHPVGEWLGRGDEING